MQLEVGGNPSFKPQHVDLNPLGARDDAEARKLVEGARYSSRLSELGSMIFQPED